jgi:hypothetical protein
MANGNYVLPLAKSVRFANKLAAAFAGSAASFFS